MRGGIRRVTFCLPLNTFLDPEREFHLETYILHRQTRFRRLHRLGILGIDPGLFGALEGFPSSFDPSEYQNTCVIGIRGVVYEEWRFTYL
jgi:hypothetical protein